MLPPLSSASPVPGLPLSSVSHICTFAQELRSDLHLCTSYPAPVPEPDNPYLTPDCRDLRPETIQHLKGKPETGINASVICPQLIIRSPYAAPFEFCLSLVNRASEPLMCAPCPRVPLPACPHAELGLWPSSAQLPHHLYQILHNNLRSILLHSARAQPSLVAPEFMLCGRRQITVSAVT
jgi:hypothetical protein